MAYCTAPHKNNHFELPVLKKLAQLSTIDPTPPIISFTPVYFIGTNDSIYESGVRNLVEAYNVLYKKEYKAFPDFLFDVLNQKIKIEINENKTYLRHSQAFILNPEIEKLYNRNGMEGLIEKYCSLIDGFYTLKRETLSQNEINSLSYYLFLNQYFRIDDDYSATINYKKLSIVLN